MILKDDEILNQQLAAIVRSSEDAIIGKTLDGIITSWNNAAEKMFDYKSEEVIGKSISIIFPPDKKNELKEILQKLSRGERITHYETERVGKNGNRISISVSISPIMNNQGRIVGAADISRDITQKKLRERQLHLFRVALESAANGIIITEKKGNIIWANKAFSSLTGYERSEAIGKNPRILKSGKQDKQFYKKLWNIILKGEVWEGEIINKNKEGKLYPEIQTITPVKNSKGEIENFIAIQYDISKLKEVEYNLKISNENLEKKQEKLSFLLKISEILSSTLDLEKTLTNLAHAVVPSLGDLCAIDLLDTKNNLKRVVVAHPDPGKVKLAYELLQRYSGDPESNSNLYNIIKTGKTQFYPEVSEELLKKNIQEKDHLKLIRELNLNSVIAVPLISHDKTFGILLFVMAESGRKYSEEDIKLAEELASRAAVAIENAQLYKESQDINYKLEKMVQNRTKKLEEINKELQTFSYSVSHDLRSPLRAIVGFSNLLKNDYSDKLDKEGNRLLNIIVQNTQQMSQLIDDLLSFSRISRLDVSKNKLDMKKLVINVWDELEIERKERKFNFNLSDLADASGDYAMIKQVWKNLLSNAVKYTKFAESPSIETGSYSDDSRIVYFVKDNGVGFDMKYSQNLFGVFQRLHKQKDFEGTGVGLAIVKRIITKHNGKVWVDASLNRGATFYFSLPKKE